MVLFFTAATVSGCQWVFTNQEPAPPPVPPQEAKLTLPPPTDLGNGPDSTKTSEESDESDSNWEEIKKAARFDKTVSYSGAATGEEYFCLTDCDVCKTEGTITIALLPDGTAKAGYSTDCYVYGENGCEKDGYRCLTELSGGYDRILGGLTFNTCSGAGSTSGSGNFDESGSSGAVNCFNSGDLQRSVTWENISQLP